MEQRRRTGDTSKGLNEARGSRAARRAKRQQAADRGKAPGPHERQAVKTLSSWRVRHRITLWPLYLKDPSGCLSRIDRQRQERKQEERLQVACHGPRKRSCGGERGPSGESVEQWSDSRHILKEEPVPSLTDLIWCAKERLDRGAAN